MNVTTPKDDLHAGESSHTWRLRLVQGLSIAVPGVLTMVVPTVGTPLLVATAVITAWVEYGRK